jgi:phage gpG-like protein
MLTVDIKLPIKNVERLEKEMQEPFKRIMDWLHRYLKKIHKDRFEARKSPEGRKWKRTSPQSILLRKEKKGIPQPITLSSIERLARRGTTTLRDTHSLYWSLLRGPLHIWRVQRDTAIYGTRHVAAEEHQQGLAGTMMGIEVMKRRAWDKLRGSREGREEFFKLIRSCWFKRYAAKIPGRLPRRRFLGVNREDLRIIDKKLEEEFKRLTDELFK